MKKAVSFLLLCMVLSSCGLFREVKKDKYDHEVKTSEKTEAKTDVEEKTIDKGQTTEIDRGEVVTEKKTTKVTETPGAKVSIGADLVRLTNGETISKDTLGARIKIGLDSLSGIIKVDLDLPPTKTTETNEEKTTEKKDKQTEDNRNKSTESKQKATTSQETANRERLRTDNSESTPKNVFWYAFIVAFIVAVIGFLLTLVKKIKR